MEEEPEGAPRETRTLSIDSGSDASKATFTLTHEDHTLGNAVRYILAKKCERPARERARGASELHSTAAILICYRTSPRLSMAQSAGLVRRV